MRRRSFVRGVGAGSVIALSGCATRENGDEDEDDDSAAELPEDELEDDGGLRVATYSSMVAEETSAGRWLAEAFEAEFPDAEIDWVVPEAGIENYIQRAQLEAEMDADVYLGLTLPELVRVDESLSEPLFEPLERSRLENDDRISADLEFGDPDGRVLPYDVGYVSLVYDETVLEPPETFEDLLEPEYEDTLLAQDPRRSAPGRAFLLWTIATFGDEYLAYWKRLWENGVDVRPRWTDAYVDGYLEEARPMVVSYTTDRIGANLAERNLDRHQVATLDDAGYETVEGVAVFAETERRELAYEFVDFVLSSEAQAEIAVRNAQFPAIEDEYLTLGTEFTAFTRRPSESVRFTYDELRERLDGWLEAWDNEFGDQLEDTPIGETDDVSGVEENGGESDDVPAENETADDETDRDTD
ncbi:thiamine ABC transporter substrate-binding protein [Natrialba swarupiae]|uniref:Thiamine ABC transporter substrate-binding protein n=1 Tax=Natrialba swarupiae TaxID=2448032 RepID=A0A5D5APG3_9EURY|nr:thiamine ABC transporter substrate-binding protein [Natrialba swarupiae]TYT63709.1 thiamine ABC transporter substrate-binding protein [Natrialba swarupiae]